MSKALDYATRMAICETVAAGMREAQLAIDVVPVPQLHGPCNVGVEVFVLGAVLGGHVEPSDVPLAPEHFWSRRHSRVWEAIQVSPRPIDLAQVAGECVLTGGVWVELEEAVTVLTDWRELAGAHVPLKDVSAAVVHLLDLARSRRLARLLARLADGICGGSESHASAQLALREHFVAERGPLVKPSPDEPTR